MRSGVNDDIVLAKLLRQDHAIVVLCASAIALLGWAYLFYQGWAMQHMDLVAMAMPSTGAWGPVDLVLVFAMWAVMMVAMMVPSATPMLLAFATISRSRCAQGRTFVPLWVFLTGYLVLWTAFSLATTLAQWGLHSLSRNWWHNTLNTNELYKEGRYHLRVEVPNASSLHKSQNRRIL